MSIQSGTWHDTLEYAAASDVGMRRGNNQDAFVIAPAGSTNHWKRYGHLFVVADGMGAHAAGELASQMAVENVSHTYYKLGRLTPPIALRRAIQEANRLIHSKGQGSVDFHGMGTTCTSLLLIPNGAVVAHVGDSRAYRLRDGVIEQFTFDHSLVWEMAEAGHVAEDDVPNFIPKNVITRSLGPHPTVDVDLEGPIPLREGDTFLLCSDGLTGPVSAMEIGSILSCLEPEVAVQTLIDIANLRGGPDNITAVVVRIRHTTSFEQPDDPDDLRTPEIADRIPGSVHPVVWSAIFILLVIALGFVALGQSVAAYVSGAGLLLAILIACMQRMDRPQAAPPLAGPFGRGPYRQYPCAISPEMIDALAKITDDLRDVARDPTWKIDCTSFESHCEEARKAVQEGTMCHAVSEYCTAIRLIMKQVREQRQGDSNIF